MHWVIRDEDKPSESILALEALEKDSDRGAAIVAASYVEELLENKIKLLLRSDGDARNELTEIFRSSGALGSFSAKIKMGFLLRLYEKICSKELDTIKNIRNEFAHSVNHLNFETDRIFDKIKNLRLIEGYIRKKSDPRPSATFVYFPPNYDIEMAKLNNPRFRFMETCGLFIAHFSNGNTNRFLSIYGDDRPPWPDILLKSLPRRHNANAP